MKLAELRYEISEVDKDMLTLFLRRMEASRLIGLYKREHELPILDQRREKELIQRQKLLLNNEQIWPFYRNFLKEVMQISREYQKK